MVPHSLGGMHEWQVGLGRGQGGGGTWCAGQETPLQLSGRVWAGEGGALGKLVGLCLAVGFRSFAQLLWGLLLSAGFVGLPCEVAGGLW